MAGICGWITDDIPQDAVETAKRMIDSLPPLGDIRIRDTATSACLHGRILSGGFAQSADGTLQGVIEGSPHWTDSGLATVAATQGAAAALLEAYARRGRAFLDSLCGSFALAIMDRNDGSAVLAVDRMGTRPLCYAMPVGGGLVFGTTADAVCRYPDVETDIDPQAIFDYVYFHMIPAPRTIYRHINKLEPGQAVYYRNSHVKVVRYWQPSFIGDEARPFRLLKEELQQLLRNAVRKCNPGNATGAFLSGGMDSSTVSGLLAEMRGSGVRAYTMGFSVPGYDEMHYARIAAKHFGLQLREYYVQPEDIARAITDVARAYDEPFGNSSAVPALLCARFAQSDGNTLLLAGDGGDELFGGNTRYVQQKIFGLYNTLPAWMRQRVLEPVFLKTALGAWPAPLRKVRSYIAQARIPMPTRTQTYNFIHRIGAPSIFAPDFLAQTDIEQPLAALDELYHRVSADSELDKMLYTDWKLTLADNDLRKVTRMCELAGIEVRYPMLDDELVEFSTQVPASLKVKGLKLRYFFKEATRDFLPREILTKPKHGFGLPFGEWLRTSAELQDLVYSSLAAIKARGVIQPAFVDELIQIHRKDHAAYYGTMVWILVMLEQWFQQHRVSPS